MAVMNPIWLNLCQMEMCVVSSSFVRFTQQIRKKSAISDGSVKEKNGTLWLWRSENLCVLRFFRCHGDFGLERQLSEAGAERYQIQKITIQGQLETVRRVIFKSGS